MSIIIIKSFDFYQQLDVTNSEILSLYFIIMMATKQQSTYDDIDLEKSPSEPSSIETQVCRYQVNDWEPRPITTEERNEYNMVCISCIFLSCMITIGIITILIVTTQLSNNDGNDI